MSKVITFSRSFPAHHPRKGEATFFVEQILNCLGINYLNGHYIVQLMELNPELPKDIIFKFQDSLSAKIDGLKKHTIRGGSRFAPGEKFSPRVWIGRPYYPNYYQGKKIPAQLVFAPVTPVKKTWSFDINYFNTGEYVLNNIPVAGFEQLKKIAMNDGFENSDDFELWFNLNNNEKFDGQIICWDGDVAY